MKWSTKVGTFKGIDVYIHATFWLIVLWVGYIHWKTGNDLESAVQGMIFILAVFICILFHEFGHALTAQKYGIKTKDITLLPIGGLARLEKIPDNPFQEFWVALAGPAVNVVISVVLYAVLYLTGSIEPIETIGIARGSFLERLMVVNIALVLFNLLPAFPMDGGRVLRAVLAMRMDYSKATHLAASIGQAMAIFFGFVGLFTNPILIFIALFVWIGATMEATIVEMKTSLNGIPVRNAMITDFYTLSSRDNLSKAVDLVIKGSQKDFPVVENNKVLGVLTQKDLLRGLSTKGSDIVVSEAMTKNFRIVDDLDMLESAFFNFQDTECKTIPVLRSGELVGLLTMDNLGEFVSIKSALGSSGAKS